MRITAAQIREARRLLRRSSAALSARAGVGFSVMLQAQLDAEISSVDTLALQAIREALKRAGVELTADGGVHLRKAKTHSPALLDP